MKLDDYQYFYYIHAVAKLEKIPDECIKIIVKNGYRKEYFCCESYDRLLLSILDKYPTFTDYDLNSRHYTDKLVRSMGSVYLEGCIYEEFLKSVEYLASNNVTILLSIAYPCVYYWPMDHVCRRLEEINKKYRIRIKLTSKLSPTNAMTYDIYNSLKHISSVVETNFCDFVPLCLEILKKSENFFYFDLRMDHIYGILCLPENIQDAKKLWPKHYIPLYSITELDKLNKGILDRFLARWCISQPEILAKYNMFEKYQQIITKKWTIVFVPEIIHIVERYNLYDNLEIRGMLHSWNEDLIMFLLYEKNVHIPINRELLEILNKKVSQKNKIKLIYKFTENRHNYWICEKYTFDANVYNRLQEVLNTY